jgi:hypothetical protein
MRTVRTRTDFFPLVVVEFEDRFTTDDFIQAIVDNEKLLDRKQRFVTIRDGRLVRTMPTPVQRKIGMQWQDEVADRLKLYCAGVVTVTHNAIARNLLTAIRWMSPPPTPEEAMEDMASALDWCDRRLAEHDLGVPGIARRVLLGPTVTSGSGR